MENLRLFVVVDLEGVSGAVYGGYGLPPSGEGHRSELLMTLELNAFVEGARKAGVKDIFVYESHPFNRERLIKGIKIVHSYDELKNCHMMAFIGQHCRAGVSSGVLSHTGSIRSILYIKVNDIEFGEFGIGAAIAGYHGIPVVFLSGDRAATEEGRFLIPEIETVSVSEGFGNHTAICLAPKKVQLLISEGMQRAIARRKTIKPLKIRGHVKFEVSLKYPAQAARMCLIPGVRLKNSRTITFRGENFMEAYKIFTAICFPLRWWDSRR